MLAALTVLLVVIGGRLIQLQGLDGAAYAAAAEEQRTRTTTLPASRGSIVDSDGTVLAYSVDSRTIFVDPSMVEPDRRPEVAEAVSQHLAGVADVTYSDVAYALLQPGRYVPVAHGVPPEAAEALVDLALPGVGQKYESSRVYPGKTVGAQVLGFTGSDGSGLAGIEGALDEKLAGQEGKLVYEVGANGAIIPAGYDKETPATPGSTVALTVDQDLQYVVEQALNKQRAALGVKSVQAVVLDAQTGQVRAMAASPGYDSSNPGATPDLLGNPTVSSVFEPGSVNKLVTMAGALEEGTVTPETVVSVPDHIQVADVTINDAWPHPTQNFTATGILAKSSNVGTIMTAQELGKKTLYEYLKAFGVGEPTGIGLAGESGGILTPPDEWSGSQVGTIPIGQGVSMTALQMASMYQTVANGGVRVPPRVVQSVTAPDGTVTPEAAPEGVRVVSEETAAELRYMLEAVVGEGGTAPLAAVPGYHIGGKTGTAQRPNPECDCYAGGGYWATFAGIAPIDDPRYVVAVVIEDPAAVTGGGGQVAAPVFADVTSYVLEQSDIPPSTTPRPDYTLIAE